MNKLQKKFINTTLGFGLAFLPSFSALADDTEIYRGGQGTSNVLFILDTSGSMGELNDDGETRMFRLRNALKDIITDVSGVNIGLMQFNSGYGAPILYPISDPDTLTGSTTRTYTAQINSESDAAEESIKEYNYSNPLGWRNVSNGEIPYLTSSDLELSNDGDESQVVGLRFTSLAIPQGSTIESAYIEFVADGDSDDSVELIIHGEDTDASLTFELSGEDISDRTSTNASVNWNISSTDSWVGNHRYLSSDVKDIVQEIVNRDGWAADNAMTFLITGSANMIDHLDDIGRNRKAWSFRNNSSDTGTERLRSPRLIVNVTASDQTVRDKLLEITEGLHGGGNTPIVDSLYEAALYFRGDDVDFGKTRGSGSSSSLNFLRVSHPDSYTGGALSRDAGCSDSDLSSEECRSEAITDDADSISPTYISPMTLECQDNYIVLLSDGAARGNNSATTNRIKGMLDIDDEIAISSCTEADNEHEDCGLELAEYLYDEDQTDTLDEVQSITLSTIGFDLASGSSASNFLSGLATTGGGSNYSASSTADLISAFSAEITRADGNDGTFVSPGIAVNTFNRLNHLNELYFAVFKPQTETNWRGNLKRYELNDSGQIVDREGVYAIEDSTGFFKDTAKSYWVDPNAANETDGRDVTKGGAANQLPADPDDRKLYTYYSSNSDEKILSDASNAVSTTNLDASSGAMNISKAMLAIDGATDDYHNNLINWIRGADAFDDDEDTITTEARLASSDPLHSLPRLATYNVTTDADGVQTHDISVFYGDNQGILHAIDTATGEEQFAYIPEEMLANQKALYDNAASSTRTYGLDGPITIWAHDSNSNLNIDPTEHHPDDSSDKDHIYVYVGMRRGGKSYYALDVTDRDNPKYMWKITGGAGGTAGFEELAQTWSKPVLTSVEIGNSIKKVLIFGGGYDTDQDTASIRTVDDTGRAIYMVDAETGELLWSASPSSSLLAPTAMTYSIPATIRVIDIGGDGLADQMYVGDMGGQVWRFDINNDASNVRGLVEGGVIANLAGDTQATHRRFYHEADVSVVDGAIGSRKLAISLGSGWHAHPGRIHAENRFYVIQTSDIYSKPDPDEDGTADYVTLTESDLYNATDNDLGEATGADLTTAQALLTAAKGWYIALNSGEKVLGSSITIGGEIWFTSYQPRTSDSVCGIQAGIPRRYRVHQNDATPVVNYDNIGGDDALTASDRSETLSSDALPSSPVRIRTDDAEIVCVGAECTSVDRASTLTRTYWLEK